jgi:hypothetical protein
MASEFDKAVAAAVLDQMSNRLAASMQSGGFNNDSVMWLIKAWTKVGLRVRSSAFHRQAAAYYVMKRDPTPSTDKRSRTLRSAINAYQSMVEMHGTTDGDFFQRADKAMLDFVWEYRKHLTGQTEKDFAAKLMKYSSMSSDQVQAEVVTNLERHA